MSMQRPVMDLMYLQDQDAPAPRRKRLWDHLAPVTKVVKRVLRVLFSQPLRIRRRGAAFVDPTPLPVRVVKGVAYRAMFVPLIVMIAAAALVFAGTHPPRVSVAQPKAVGVYYEPISFNSADGTKLEGWLVPVIDARRVLEQKDKVLRQIHPAVVLVHDFGHSPDQVMPLIDPLHDDGFIVLTVGLRGVGAEGFQTRGQTFGLRESQDVLAAVEALRRRAFVDGDRVAVVGIGTGANAALLAARDDPRIAALVLADPVRKADDVIRTRLGPQRRGLRWMQSVNKWAFQVAYRVNAEDLDLDRFRHMTESPRTLVLSDATSGGSLFEGTIDMTREFLKSQFGGGPVAGGDAVAGEPVQ